MMAAQEFEIAWRDVADDPPPRGMFVEIAKASNVATDRFGLNDSKKTPLDRLYWSAPPLRTEGMFWRPVPPENFLRSEPTTDRPPIEEDDWLVVLLEPQQEIPATYRIHEDHQELFVPIIRRRVKTGRTGRNGQKVTRILPRPMFPGYGLIRAKAYGDNINHLLSIRGVREVLRDKSQTGDGEWLGKPITIPHEAVLAIFRKQSQKHHEFNQSYPKRFRQKFKPNESVRVQSEGSVYDGYLATIEKDDGKDRIAVLLGMAKIRHTLPADMVVAV